MQKTRTAAKTTQCTLCSVEISTSGFAVTAHNNSARHIEALRSAGRNEEADTISRGVEINKHNRSHTNGRQAAGCRYCR